MWIMKEEQQKKNVCSNKTFLSVVFLPRWLIWNIRVDIRNKLEAWAKAHAFNAMNIAVAKTKKT